MTTKVQITLWPIFLLELLSLVIWIPIAALAGMGYAPQFNWGNVFLLIFHLYPVYILLAIAASLLLKHSEKANMALTVALLPPLISASGLGLLFAYAEYKTPRQTAAEIVQANQIFKEKCLEAGEHTYILTKDSIDSVFVESQAPTTITRIENGHYAGGEGPPDNFYGVTNSGYLKQYEIPTSSTSLAGSKPYKRFGYADTTGTPVDSLESKYLLRFISKVNEDEKRLGVWGGVLEVVKIEDKSVVSRSTYFNNRWSNKFCGHAEDGQFSSFLFLRRALNLKPIYKSAYLTEVKTH